MKMLVAHSQRTEKIVINKNKNEGIANAYPKKFNHQLDKCPLII